MYRVIESYEVTASSEATIVAEYKLSSPFLKGKEHSNNMNYLIIRTISVLITSYITKVGVPLVLAWQTGWTAFLFAVVLAVINHTIKPAIAGITLPITLLTLGAFSVVVNGAMIYLAAFLVPGFSIPSFVMAMVFAAVLTLVNFVLHIFE
jgi:uncharacterized membrane protein YvlD (DUF360 family)